VFACCTRQDACDVTCCILHCCLSMTHSPRNRDARILRHAKACRILLYLPND
jgi:hypothetical protein